MLATATRIPGTVQQGQASCGDVFGTYPCNGFPALINSGAVTKRGAFHGPIPPNMLPRRLTRGMGDTTYDIFGQLPETSGDTIDSGGGGFWDALGQTAINMIPSIAKTGENIATARYAVPPPGTLIKTPTSMIYTQPTAQQAAASGILTGGLLTGSSSLLPIILIAAVAIFAMKS